MEKVNKYTVCVEIPELIGYDYLPGVPHTLPKKCSNSCPFWYLDDEYGGVSKCSLEWHDVENSWLDCIPGPQCPRYQDRNK